MKFTKLLVITTVLLLIQSCDTQDEIVPESFFGTWDGSLLKCADDVSLERLIITSKTIQYWESLGSVVSVKKVSGTEIVVSLSVKDDAEQKLESPRYQLNDARSKLTEVFSDGSIFDRVRCK
jgi:hypothetical protein